MNYRNQRGHYGSAGRGKIVLEKTEVPGVGQLSLFEDLDGRVLGMWKQVKRG